MDILVTVYLSLNCPGNKYFSAWNWSRKLELMIIVFSSISFFFCLFHFQTKTGSAWLLELFFSSNEEVLSFWPCQIAAALGEGRGNIRKRKVRWKNTGRKKKYWSESYVRGGLYDTQVTRGGRMWLLEKEREQCAKKIFPTRPRLSHEQRSKWFASKDFRMHYIWRSWKVKWKRSWKVVHWKWDSIRSV